MSTVDTIENSAWRLDDLPIAPAFQLGRFRAAFRVVCKLPDMLKHTLHEFARCLRIFKRDVIGDFIQLIERGFGPDYFSHRAMR